VGRKLDWHWSYIVLNNRNERGGRDVKAAVVHELNRPVVVEDVETEGPKSGEIVVKIAATGVCHSCYHAVTGAIETPLPVVLGDEGAGVVEEVGPRSPWSSPAMVKLDRYWVASLGRQAI
jgi:hypothetical protein